MSRTPDDLLIAAFPGRADSEAAAHFLGRIGATVERIEPTPPLALVAAPALATGREPMARLVSEATTVAVAGWVDHRPPARPMPEGPAPAGEPEPFGRASIVSFRSCATEWSKTRITAEISGDLEPVFPYLNAVMPSALYGPETRTLTYMDGFHLVTLHPNRVMIAKATDIVDAWLILEDIRARAVAAWADRDRITPCMEPRIKPPALEIWKRLPRTNCGQCGESTCLAFAIRVWMGEVDLRECPSMQGGTEPIAS